MNAVKLNGQLLSHDRCYTIMASTIVPSALSSNRDKLLHEFCCTLWGIVVNIVSLIDSLGDW